MTSSAQREIFREYYGLVYGIIYYMVKDHATTEDLIQESFLHILRRMPVIDDEAKLKGWIRTVVKNRVYTYLKKNRRLREEIADDSIFVQDELLASGTESIEAEVATKLMSETIGQCLQQLKPEYRALIELRWQQELSYKEMADILETSEESIKYKLHRAREAVRKRFIKLWGEREDARRIR
ncbi:RNA polymerase sigma factor [Cohnella fermenti]|nr:sigma-70 family RNA polymerase sigma factor [Cohnella fermenti]